MEDQHEKLIQAIKDKINVLKERLPHPVIDLIHRLWNTHLIFRSLFYGSGLLFIGILLIVPKLTGADIVNSAAFAWLMGLNLNVVGIILISAVMLSIWVTGYLLFRLNLTPSQITSIGKVLKRMAEDKVFPMQVEVNQELPISFREGITIPMDATLSVSLKERVHVEGEIPIRVQLPVDTVVEAPILNFGTVKIPIRAIIPLEVTIPVSATVNVTAEKIKIHLEDDLKVMLPELLVPVQATIKTSIPLSLGEE